MTRDGSVPSGSERQGRATSALRARMRVRQHSLPERRAMSMSPRRISSAVVFTSICGVLPPGVVYTVSRVVTPRASASRRAGSL